MDRVLLGKGLPESLALLDKRIPPSSSGRIDSGTNSLVRDIRSRKFRGRTGDAAHRWNPEPAARRTSDIDCNYPRKLGRTDETGTLSRADERERVRNLDMKKSTDSWNKIRDLRHTLIQYLLQENRFGTGEDET